MRENNRFSQIKKERFTQIKKKRFTQIKKNRFTQMKKKRFAQIKKRLYTDYTWWIGLWMNGNEEYFIQHYKVRIQEN